MTERAGEQAPQPREPELTPAQEAIKSLCDEILALKPARVRTSFYDVDTAIDPGEVQVRLRAGRLGDLMLRDGDSLSAAQGNDRYPELGLFIGDAKLVVASVRAWGWEEDKVRIDPTSSVTPPYNVVTYPGEKDWTRRLDINLWYSNGRQEAAQTISAYTSSARAGVLPLVSRDVTAVAYMEQGYEGHNQLNRPTQSDAEVLEFVALARALVDSRLGRSTDL